MKKYSYIYDGKKYSKPSLFYKLQKNGDLPLSSKGKSKGQQIKCVTFMAIPEYKLLKNIQGLGITSYESEQDDLKKIKAFGQRKTLKEWRKIFKEVNAIYEKRNKEAIKQEMKGD